MKTTIQEPWALGVDPGYGHTGAVLRRADYPSPVSWACWENHHTNDWCIMRSMSIVVPMMEATLGWVVEHEINDLEVCIEYPIYNGNARVLMVQMSLFDLICQYSYEYLRPNVPKLWLTTVNNKTSKRLLTHDGKADKKAMVAASPWTRYKSFDLTFVQAHTLADSYAHSLIAGQREWDLSNMDPCNMDSTVYHNGRVRKENIVP